MSNPTHLRRAATRAASAIAVGLRGGCRADRCPGSDAGQPRHRERVRRSRRLHGHQHRFEGVLNGDLGVSSGARRLGGRPRSTAPPMPTTRSPPRHSCDLTTAYNVAAGQTPGDRQVGQNLGGQHLAAGAYAFSSDAQLTGTLTLDAGGDPNAQFVIMITSALTTASNSSVVLDGRRFTVQRVLAGRQLRDAGHHDGIPGQPDGALVDRGAATAPRSTATAGPQRRGHARQQRHQSRAVQRDHLRTGLAASGGGGRVPADRHLRAAEPRGQRRHVHLDAHSALEWTGLRGRVPRHGPRSHDRERRLPSRRPAHRQPHAVAVPGVGATPEPATLGDRTASRSGTPRAPRQ